MPRPAANAGLTYKGLSGNYISTITAPAVLGGYELSEFTNGYRSGWMYTVNGSHPGVGLNACYLNNGDVVIWHYVNDYAYEVSDWFDDPDYPNLGNTTTWDIYLNCADVNPTAAVGEPASSAAQDLAATVKDGSASAAVTAATMTELIDQAVKEKAASVDLNVTGADKADTVAVEVPKASLTEMTGKTDASLNVKTPIGNVSLNQAALEAIAEGAAGSTVQVVLEKQDATDEQKSQMGEYAAVTQVTILSGGKEITDLGSGKVKLSLPIPEGLSGKTLAVSCIDGNGSLVKAEGTVVTISGKQYYQIEISGPGVFTLAEAEKIDAAIAAQNGEMDAEKAARIKAGVENTTIKLWSTFSKKNNIQLNWTKSAGYKVDCYQVYKSTKRYSGYGTKAYYQTTTGTKNFYINTKELKKGTRYFYKVRGVRTINGEKVYTQWSNKAWRISRVNKK